MLSSDTKIVGGRACAPGLKRSGNGNKNTSVLTITPPANLRHTGHTPSQTDLATLLPDPSLLPRPSLLPHSLFLGCLCSAELVIAHVTHTKGLGRDLREEEALSGAAPTHYRATLSIVVLGGEGRGGEGRGGREGRGGEGRGGRERREGRGGKGREGEGTTVLDYHVSSTCIIALLLLLATKSQGRGLMNTEH